MADDVKTGAPASGVAAADPQNVNAARTPSQAANVPASVPAQGDQKAPADHKGGQHQRSHLIQRPAAQNAGEASDAIINSAEQAEYDRAEAERKVAYNELPASVIAEMEAGKAALKRHQPVGASGATGATGATGSTGATGATGSKV